MLNIRNLSPETIELFEGEGYTNRELSSTELVRRLEAHGNIIEYNAHTGECFVVDDDNALVNTTNWTLFDLLDYLNY